MHRMHHAFSDTEKDPHSPHFFEDVFQMMWNTRGQYVIFEKDLELPEPQFRGDYAEWKLIDDSKSIFLILNLLKQFLFGYRMQKHKKTTVVKISFS